MSAQHTPGPWSVDVDARVTFVRDPSGNYLFEMDIGAMDHGFERALFDANLAAAAPELLDALKYVWDAYGFDPSIDSAIWQTALAAIAKAESLS